mmetsp:Transcript_11398/g.23319  ORF Transcript_11398/g.23319 Transcript_11398/m.23319 type:complete len:238 (-) Transcript_11398:508-1221(-)
MASISSPSLRVFPSQLTTLSKSKLYMAEEVEDLRTGPSSLPSIMTVPLTISALSAPLITLILVMPLEPFFARVKETKSPRLAGFEERVGACLEVSWMGRGRVVVTVRYFGLGGLGGGGVEGLRVSGAASEGGGSAVSGGVVESWAVASVSGALLLSFSFSSSLSSTLPSPPHQMQTTQFGNCPPCQIRTYTRPSPCPLLYHRQRPRALSTQSQKCSLNCRRHILNPRPHQRPSLCLC